MLHPVFSGEKDAFPAILLKPLQDFSWIKGAFSLVRKMGDFDMEDKILVGGLLCQPVHIVHGKHGFPLVEPGLVERSQQFAALFKILC